MYNKEAILILTTSICEGVRARLRVTRSTRNVTCLRHVGGERNAQKDRRMNGGERDRRRNLTVNRPKANRPPIADALRNCTLVGERVAIITSVSGSSLSLSLEAGARVFLSSSSFFVYFRGARRY